MTGFILIFAAVLLLLVLLTLTAVAVAIIWFWPQIKLAIQLARLLPNMHSLFRVAAAGLRTAKQMTMGVGSVTCTVGEGFKSVGTTLGGDVFPNVSFEATPSLWSALQEVGIPLPSEPPPGFDQLKVVKNPSLSWGPVPGSSNFTTAGNNLMGTARSLGAACPPTGGGSNTPLEGSVADGFEKAADGLDSVADLLEELVSA